MSSKVKKFLSVILASAMTAGSFGSLPVTISAADLTDNEENIQQAAEDSADQSLTYDDSTENDQSAEESAVTSSSEESDDQNDEIMSSFDSVTTVELDENGDVLYVRASADEGVIPNGAVFSAKKVDSEDEKSKAGNAVSALRETGEILTDSYLLDLTFYDADGNEIEPSGDVTLTVGLLDAGSISDDALSSVKTYLSNNINEKINNSANISDKEILNSQINSAIDELSLSYNLNDLSFNMYHIENNEDSSVTASKVDLTARDADADMTDAGLVFEGKVSSFSNYQIELSLKDEFAQNIDDISNSIIESYSYVPAAVETDAGDNTYSYRIVNDNKVSISDMAAALKKDAGFPDVNIISGTSLNSDVSYSGTGTDRIFTIPVGGDSYKIVLYDNSGSSYTIDVYSDLPKVTKTSSADFTIRWNDNGGNDEANLVARPAWSDISNSYVIKYSIDDEEAQELTNDSLAFLGFDSVPKLTPDTDTSLTSWTFSISDLPTSYTQNNGNEKQTHKINYYIEQKQVPEGYINDNAVIEMNSSIINTVKVLFESKLIWKDNNNKYGSRPVREKINELLENGTITVMRYDAHSSSAAQEIAVTEDNFEFKDCDGYEICRLVNLPSYCDEEENYGAPYIYSVIFNPQVNPEYAKADPGSEYIGTYTNVDNYGSYSTALYNGGTLTELLSNTVDFSYTKYWDDNNNNNNRPNTKLYFYVATEDDILSDSFNTNKASAVAGYSYVDVPTENGTYTACVDLPKYNDQGQRLIYFAIERGLTGDYISGVDNSNGIAGQDVKDVFDQIKGSYINRNTGEYYPKYLLNGGTIDNRLSGSVTASVTKTINAVAMQEMSGAEINFVLQKMVKNVSEDGEVNYSWIDASKGDLVSHDSSEEGQITLTLNGFRAENMTQTGTSDELKKYNPDGETIIYRWKEVSVSINGSETKDISWAEDYVSPESMTYKTASDVQLGKYAPGIGADMVDVYLSGETSTSVDGSGATLTTVDNNINAPYLVKVEKTWTVNGKNVSSDIGDSGYATFEILDSDGNAVEDENGNPITITLTNGDLTTDGSKWETVYSSLPRFDEDGREYSYSIKEIAADDGGYAQSQGISNKWSKDITYSMAVDATGNGDETAKELIAKVSNYIEEPEGNTVLLAAKKIWQDDGDLISRAPVIAGIYYIGDDGYGLVDTVTLTESGLWYKKTRVSTGDSYYQYSDGEWTAAGTLPETITNDDFVIVELGTGSTKSVTPITGEEDIAKDINVPANEATLAKMNFGSEDAPVYRTYEEWSKEDLSSIKNKITDADTKLGIVADNEDDSEGTSNYTYMVSERTGYIEPAEMNGYILTDTRIGKLNIDLTKTWNDGGDNRVGHFALYRNDSDEPVFEFDLGKGNGTVIDNLLDAIGSIAKNLTGANDLNADIDAGSIIGLTGASYIITMESETSEQKIDVVKNYNIKLLNLPKYDENGVLYTYTLKETGIYSNDGELIPVTSGHATVDEKNYSASCSIDASKGDGGIVYGELHHTDDWIYWNANNSLTGSYNLNFYKVWYDDAEDSKLRPNVYFDIYRVSTNIWINNNKYTLKTWIEDELWKEGSSIYGQFNSEEAAFSYLFSKYYDSKDQWTSMAEKITTVTADRYYDASGNKYVWSIDVGDVAQYDEDGYPYIYFAIENGISEDSDYYGNEYYGNMKWDDLHVNTDATTAKDTYDIYNSGCYEDYVSNTLLVLSDGIHNVNGDAGAYYSRTIVNSKVDSRTISGRKIWNTDPINVNKTYLPTVKMALYRSTSPITDQDIDEYSHEQMQEWIDSTSAEKVAAFTLNDSEAGYYSFTDYTYRIKYEDLDGDGEPDTKTTYDADGNEQTVKSELPRYDEYGNTYYYYVMELGDADGNEIPGYKDNPTYNAAYFYLTNVYDVRKQPYVSIQVGKEWEITKDALEQNPELKVSDLSPVNITLYAIMQDEDGNPIGKPIEMQTIKYDPNAEDISAYDSINIDSDTGSIYATFSRYEAANSTIPYYAPNGRAFLFYVTETSVNGYDSKIISGGTEGNASDQNDASKRHYINLELNEEDSTYYNKDDEKVSFENTYTGDPTVSFKPVKYWADSYVDNSDYRPAAIRFTIERSSAADPEGSGWSKTVVFNKTDDNKSSSSWSVNNTSASALTGLLKFDAMGNAYTYRITKEEFLDEGGNVIASADQVDELIDNYQLDEIKNDSVKNKLNNSVSINLSKNWTYELAGEDGENAITYEQFKELREMNALPVKVRFVVERSLDGNTWTRVKASDEESDHKITVDDAEVVGYEVDINSITEDNFGTLFNTQVSWDNLPAAAYDSTELTYQYRVSEILTMKDSTGAETDIEYNDGSKANGIESYITSESKTETIGNSTVTTYTVNARNILEAKKLRLAKEWADNGGRDNTRPDSLEMTIKSANGEHTYTLTTSKANEDYNPDNPEASIYYSDYFLIPGYLDVTEFEGFFKIEEATIETANYTNTVTWPTAEETDGSNSYVIKLTNTLTDERKTISLKVNKKWDDYYNWEENLRPDMIFTLQYLKQGGNANNSDDWISMTDIQGDANNIANFTVVPDGESYTPSAVYNVKTTDDYVNNYGEWKYLKKYWDVPSHDGISELIRYRVIETRADGKEMPSSSYVGAGSNVFNRYPVVYTFDVNDYKNVYYEGKITNYIRYKDINIKKKWLESSTENEISKEDVENLVKLKALPEAISFKVYYTDTAGHTNEEIDVTFERNVVALASDNGVNISLPRYDKNGSEIKYTISEYQIKYKDGEWQDAGKGIGLTNAETTVGEDGAKVTFTNTFSSTSRSVTKQFIDENNRDGLQGNVVVQLYRDGEKYGSEVVLSADTGWTNTWSLLPYYKNDATGTGPSDVSVYTLKEVSVNGVAIGDSEYTAPESLGFTYNPTDNIGTVTLKNVHKPYRGTISANKVWNDIEQYGTRIDSTVELALQYFDTAENEWKFVSANATFDDNDQYKGDSIPAAYTSSDLIQEADGRDKSASWNDVPVNYNGQKIKYRVVEVTSNGSDLVVKTTADKDGYEINYPESTFSRGNMDDQKMIFNVENKLITQKASVSKNWNGDDTWSDETRPDSIVIYVNWTHNGKEGSGIADADGKWYEKIELNAENNWSMDNIVLPLYDSEGCAYTYTITEKYKFGDDEIDKSGYDMALAIANADGSKWKIEAAESDNVWTLSLKDENSEAVDEALSLNATNTLRSGNLTVTKIWDDDQNREADRENITVQLYRDGEAIGNPVTLKPNDWSYTWNDLPVYQQNGTDKSYYTIEETNAKDNWQVTYDDGLEYDGAKNHGAQLNEDETVAASIKNTISPNYFTINAEKIWDDNDDRYNVSASFIWVQLMYSTDKENWYPVESTPSDTDAYENGTKVYTSSDLKQKITISGENRTSSIATWNDLPEMVRTTDAAAGGESKTVYYKVVECEPDDGSESSDMSAYYEQSSDVISYENADDGLAKINLTNTLPMGSLKVVKTWEEGDQQLRPDSIDIKLYRIVNGQKKLYDEQKLTEDDEWTYTWENLPIYDNDQNLIKYQVEETSIAGYTVSYSNDNVTWSDDCEITLARNEETDTYIKNSQITGSLTVDKSWDDTGFEAERPQSIKYTLYRNDVVYDEQTVTLNSEGAASYTWENLPVYDKEGKAFIYKVTEESFDGYETSYEGNEISLDNAERYASVTVKNKIRLGSIEVNKLWADENNRENKRCNVTVNLYRDGALYNSWSSEADESVDYKDSWKHIFINLPIYQAGGKTPSVYRIEEICDDSDYTASWSGTVDNITLNDSETVSRTVTNTYAAQKGSIMASKIWDDYDNSMNSRPQNSEIRLKLQYSIDNGISWNDITKNTINESALYPDDGIYTTSDVIQTADGADKTATWDNLPVYHYNEETLTNDKVSYRVAETEIPSGYDVSYSADSVSLDGQDDSKSVTVTNTLNTSGLTIKKIWNENGADASLIRPLSLRFVVEYRANESEEWKRLPDNAYDKEGSTATLKDGYVTMTGTADDGWTDILISGLADKNAYGEEYQYRVQEVGYSYLSDASEADFISVTNTDDEIYAGAYKVTYDNGVVAGNGTVVVTNTLETANLKVSKKWLDEDNRDLLRPSADEDGGITVQLYRDGEKYGEPVTICNADADDANTWTYEWTNLPYYQTGNTGKPSSYYVEEVSVDGYETIYNDGSADYTDASLSVTTLDESVIKELYIKNIHTPEKTEFTAEKLWDDNSDLFNKRPDSIYLTLMYKIEGEEEDWSLVTKAKAEGTQHGNIRYADGGIHTTSDVVQLIQTAYEQNGDSQTTSWENLTKTVVVNGESRKIIYKAFETDAEGNAVGKSANGYRVTYETDSTDDCQELITNKLMTTSMTISKSWTGDEAWTDIIRPSKITFFVEYSLDGGESWSAYTQDGDDAVCVDGFVTMSGDDENSWQDIVINDLPLIDEDGNYYMYRAAEYSIEINGETVLCQSSENDDISEDGVRITYSKAGAYDSETDTWQNENETWSVTASNTLETGSLSISKTWADGNDRDGIRPDSISFDLHRVDKIGENEYDEVIDTVTIKPNSDGSWSEYTWDELPIWSRDGAGKASYYVTEAEIAGYKSSYKAASDADAEGITLNSDSKTEIQVTNTHETAKMTVSASKIWDDNSNARGLRDSSVSFTLQYSLDGGKTWQNVKKLSKTAIPDASADKGDEVWTSSDVTQTISGNMTDSKWTGFSWENLPAYAPGTDGSSAEVLYRVTEELSQNTSTNYTVVNGNDISYSKSVNGTADISITNKVNPDTSNDSGKSNAGTVNTGDNSGYVFWALLMTGAFVSMLYTTVRYKRRK